MAEKLNGAEAATFRARSNGEPRTPIVDRIAARLFDNRIVTGAANAVLNSDRAEIAAGVLFNAGDRATARLTRRSNGTGQTK
jgi:hypothetical protein